MEKKRTQLAPLPVLVAPLIVSGIPLLMMQFFPKYLYRTMDVPGYLVVHNVAEFFSIMVSFSIFGIGWYAYDQSKNSHAVFLSIAFLAIGLMDFMHALSYAGMPALITQNSANKSTQFWIAARLFAAVTFFISAYVYPDTDSRWPSRTVLLLSALSISGLVFVGVTFFPSRLPTTFVEGVGLTPFKKFSEYVVITVLSFTTLAYWRRFSRTGQKLLLYYIAALIICIFSEFAFAIYESVFDTFNVIGHIYKIAAFYLMYKGIFSASVKAPYVRLADISEKLGTENAQRRRFEDELKSSLRQWQTTFDAISDAVCLIDKEHNIMRCNSAMMGLTGKPERELKGRKCYELVHGTSSPIAGCPLQRTLISHKREMAMFPLNGKWFNVAVDPLIEENGNLSLIHILTDVTESKEAEERLRSMAAYNRSLIETSLDPLVTIGPDGKITDVNRATETVTGRMRKELIDTDFSEYFTEPEKARAGYEQVFKEGFVLDYPLEIRHRDGSLTPVLYNAALYRDEAGKVIGVFAAARDITEQKSTEEKLKGLALRNEMILNSAGEGIYGTDINGAIVFMNPAAQNMLGFTMNDVIGQNSHQLFHHTKADGSPYPVEECPLHKSSNNGETHREVDEVFWTRDGRKFSVEHVNTPLVDSGIVVGSVAVFRDVTDQRKMMDAEVARMRAEAASKAKSDFLANMSHELRTPLNSIIGFSEVMQDGMTGPINWEQAKYLGYIHGSGKHLLSLINDILDLSKIEAGKLELDLTSVSVADVLNSALIMQKEKVMTHNIRVDLEISPDADVEITADQRKLKQILFNLLSNALKFTKEGGAVWVRARRTGSDIGGEIVDCIEISVEDTGMGIKAEDITRLFAEFTQLQPPGAKEYEGTGLGLALSKKLVGLHGGKIWAESKFGKGSKFTFVIPVVIPIGVMKKDDGKT